jgi:hypothetical protein
MIINSYIYGVGYDPDAQLFITATGISGTNATATNQLVLDLKSANIWTKMKAVYPFVGGTASSQKYNLKDARDLNAAFRLTFNGGATFSSNGYQPNGTNAYANTFLNASTNVTINNTHISFYSRTDQANSNFEMGATFLLGVQQYLGMYLRTAVNIFWSLCNVNQTNVTGSQSSNTDSRGFFIANRSSSISLKGFRNGTKVLDNTTPSGVAINYPIFISSINSSGSPSGYSSRECAFASIGDGLTDAEALAFYNAVQTFNTTLARQV